jgi:hypothetical protein
VEESENFCAERVGECRPEISRGAELDSWGRAERFLTKKKKKKRIKLIILIK